MKNKIETSSGIRFSPGDKITAHQIAKAIDHSLLKPEMTTQEVIDGCKLAMDYDCATVCVKPCDVILADGILKDSDVLVTTVIGFPHGHNLKQIKLLEAEIAIDQGCKELDMVLNIGRLKSREFDYIEDEIGAICDLSHKMGVIVKVIFENAYLSEEEIISACRISEKAGADFVKTSTGYAKSGATIKDIKLMRAVCSPAVRIKAAHGVRTLKNALEVLAAGAVRFGATATKQIMDDARLLEAQGKLILPGEI